MKLKVFGICSLLFFLTPFLVACGVKGKVSLNVTGTPLKISVDTNGKVSFTVDSGIKFPTPLGVVEAGLVVEPTEFFRDHNPEGILTVRLNENDYFYDLHGQDFDLKFESGYYKQVNLIKTGPNLFLELVKLELNSEQQVLIMVVTATSISSSGLVAPQTENGVPAVSNTEPQFDSDDPEGFLRWFFHEIWAIRDYENLWDYLSDDFRQRIDQSYSSYVKNWEAIGSIEEPIEIKFEGKEGISLKYRVTYTTLSRKNGYTDRRRDLFWLYFNTSKGHWEFK
jgi:hypothetical protein